MLKATIFSLYLAQQIILLQVVLSTHINNIKNNEKVLYIILSTEQSKGDGS